MVGGRGFEVCGIDGSTDRSTHPTVHSVSIAITIDATTSRTRYLLPICLTNTFQIAALEHVPSKRIGFPSRDRSFTFSFRSPFVVPRRKRNIVIEEEEGWSELTESQPRGSAGWLASEQTYPKRVFHPAMIKLAGLIWTYSPHDDSNRLLTRNWSKRSALRPLPKSSNPRNIPTERRESCRRCATHYATTQRT